jgi:hypothetical protein
MQRDGGGVGPDVDPLGQQPEDARLLGWVKLVPDRLERAESLDYLAFIGLGLLSCKVISAAPR